MDADAKSMTTGSGKATIVKCVDSVTAHGGHQPDRGGAIPASTLHLWIGETDTAMGLVKQFHYSHRWPSNIQLVVTAHESGGLFGNKGDALAAVVFSIPGTRWSVPVWELCRLVRRDDAHVPLSWLIARAVSIIRQKKLADLLVSFADAQHGHHGGVYRASNWHYHGKRASRIEGFIVRGEFVPNRSASHRWGTQSRARLAERGITAKYDEGKHLYWLPVTKIGKVSAAILNLRHSDANQMTTANGVTAQRSRDHSVKVRTT